MTKIEKVSKELKTSTGSFKFADVCEQLLALEGQKKLIEDSIKLIRNSLMEKSENLPYESESGKICLETKGEFEQDVKALFKALPEEVFFRACSISKSKLSDDKEEKKKLSAIVELNTIKTGESQYLKVYLDPKGKRVHDETIKIK